MSNKSDEKPEKTLSERPRAKVTRADRKSAEKRQLEEE